MKNLPQKIVRELSEFRRQQESLLEEYIRIQSNEMVYVVYWSILEKFVKTVTSQFRRQQLADSLSDWRNYLNGKSDRPSKNSKTNLECHNLPDKSEFISASDFYGFSGDAIWRIMDSKGKYRRNRNEIAHVGKKFINVLHFQDLCRDLDSLIESVYNEMKSNKRMQSDAASPRR